jgi:uncharacterized protein (DUF427 family)
MTGPIPMSTLAAARTPRPCQLDSGRSAWQDFPHSQGYAEMSNDHPITISPVADRVVVRWRGRAIVDTTHALELKEARYPAVYYVPRGDADMSVFARSSHESTCPFKGRAKYFTLKSGADLDANAVWTYETPISTVEAIKEYLAFYPDKVEITRTPA